MLPSSVKYVVVGAGIHGLSAAWHLAQQLKAAGRGDGRNVVVIDKTGIAAGASGIACGIIRNNYYQPAMRELMAHSVAKWEQDPQGYCYHPVGYMQISPESMHEDVAGIHQQQKAIGYPSRFIEGEADCTKYMRSIFHDWRAKGVTSVLHELKGGYAQNRPSMFALADKAKAQGVRIITGVTVTGFETAGGAINKVNTDQGDIETDYVVIGVGPWVKTVWDMLDLPKTIDVRVNSTVKHDVAMWHYLCLEEGTLGVHPTELTTNDGKLPPVVHLDTDAPLHSDVDGSLITDQLWGIYYKPDFGFGGVQGGSAPWAVEGDPDDVKVDPYGIESPDFVVGDNFKHMWCSALAFCHERFAGKIGLFKDEPSGGLGCFTPDSFPVFDVFKQNCYIIADSNHGYKMLGVGELVAKEIMGESSRLLEPFRFSRYTQGKLHPVSHSPFPWS
jgi:glycine/D-amino acid oxidase-like deaminating enzyme